MSPAPRGDDELGRWAAKQAPAVLAQARSEAAQLIRDALVEAAVGGAGNAGAKAKPNSKPEAGAETPSELPPQGDLLWAYCVLMAGDEPPPDLIGIDSHSPIERVQAEGLTALVSRVPRTQFGAEPLSRNLNDLAWLERVARAHEAVLDATLAQFTIVPLRMCTLYESGESVRRVLQQERESFVKALAALEGRFEWAVKVLTDPRSLIDVVQADSNAGGPIADQEDRGEGSSYMLRRRSERTAREAASSLARSVAEDVHARLQDWAISAMTHPAQNRDLSGHSGEMVLNAAYLVERSRTAELRELVAELGGRHRDIGAVIELTGPWPPYNFIPAGCVAGL